MPHRQKNVQVVDPAVSRAKFDQQVTAYREAEKSYRERGCLLVETAFPKVEVILAAPQLRPPPIIFGVKIDFANYDLWPPSVTLVKPFTGEPYRAKELPTPLPKAVPEKATNGEGRAQVSRLMQAHESEDIPFLCVPGVREYHWHPAHTDDSWLQYRGKGEGTLSQLLETLIQYGVTPFSGYQFQVNLNVQAVNLHMDKLPE